MWKKIDENKKAEISGPGFWLAGIKSGRISSSIYSTEFERWFYAENSNFHSNLQGWNRSNSRKCVDKGKLGLNW